MKNPRSVVLASIALASLEVGAASAAEQVTVDNFVRADRSVRDFLHFTGAWPFAWDFPAFNVADACITVGAVGLFVLLWRDDRKPKAAQVS
jgi:lipoprotein signal peptidase